MYCTVLLKRSGTRVRVWSPAYHATSTSVPSLTPWKKFQSHTGKDKTGKDKTEKDKTGKDKTGKDKTGKDKPGRVSSQGSHSEVKSSQDNFNIKCQCKVKIKSQFNPPI